jgi:hypothetical protein
MQNQPTTLSELIYCKEYIPSTTPVKQVVDYFKQQKRTFIVVADDHTVAGLVGRDKLLISVSSPQAWALYAQKPIASLMDKNPLIFDGKGDIVDLFRKASSRPIETVYDDVIISMNGTFTWLLSVKQLMRCMIQESESRLEPPKVTVNLSKKPIIATFFDHKTTSANADTAIDPYAYTMSPSRDDVFRIHLRGRLDAFSVVELMQMLVQGTKTGRLDVPEKTKNIPLISVFFDRGKIIHAEGGGEKGKNALWRALKITEGDFAFHPGLRCTITTIYEDPMFLLMEACRLQDESAYGLKKL